MYFIIQNNTKTTINIKIESGTVRFSINLFLKQAVVVVILMNNNKQALDINSSL